MALRDKFSARHTEAARHHRPCLWSSLVALGMLAYFQTVAWACPMCKEAFLEPGQFNHKLLTAKGYALSILLMLAVPLVLIASVALRIIQASRRKQTIVHPRE